MQERSRFQRLVEGTGGWNMALVVEERSSSDAPAPTVTVASLARDWGISDPNRIAMREKDFGIWQEYSWARTWGLVMDAAHGLLALGIDVGDRVSIQAEDRPEWVILDLAAVAVRGITVGFYPTNPAAEVKYLLTDCGATVHLAEDQEQVDRVLEIDPAAVPNLGRIIYCEPRGVNSYSDDRLMDWDDFLAAGRQHRAENPDAVVDRMAEARPDDVMTLVYTSGTTGPPKGAMLTNANTEFSITRIMGEDGLRGKRVPTADDLVVTYLPLSLIHI